MKIDSEKLLLRRLYLQRYITSVTNRVKLANENPDREFVRFLRRFFHDPDPRAMQAVAKQVPNNRDYRLVLNRLKQYIKTERQTTTDILQQELDRLVDREIKVTTAALDKSDTPSSKGLLGVAVAGVAAFDELIVNLYNRYYTRLLTEISRGARENPGDVVGLVRGLRKDNYKNGLYHWRNVALLGPDIDRIIHGTATNAADKVYAFYDIDKVDHVATLDFRVCERCYTAEVEGPYKRGTEPIIPVHPRCRCVNLPHVQGGHERPYVKDFRPVRNIPKSERRGKIGRTFKTIEEFFDGMNQENLKRYLGPSRYKLWTQGKINSIDDLVSEVNLQPLTLDELPE